MLDNYIKDSNGVIKQKECQPFLYDYSYANHYNLLPTNDIMSHLRLGYIVGSIGKFNNLLWTRYITISNSRRCLFCREYPRKLL